MIDQSTIYRAVERHSHRVVQTTFGADGILKVTVHLESPTYDISWIYPLTSELLAKCQSHLEALSETGVTGTAPPNMQIIRVSAGGDKEIASWELRSESIDHSKARQLIQNDGHTMYVVALAYLKLGESLELQHDENAAGIAFKEGVASLGNSYVDQNVLDDTGLKLVLAKNTEARHGVAKAAPIYQRILESRITTLVSRDHLTAGRVL